MKAYLSDFAKTGCHVFPITSCFVSDNKMMEFSNSNLVLITVALSEIIVNRIIHGLEAYLQDK